MSSTTLPLRNDGEFCGCPACLGYWGDGVPCEMPCGRFYAPAYPADYLFCYQPQGHAGPCKFTVRRRRPFDSFDIMVVTEANSPGTAGTVRGATQESEAPMPDKPSARFKVVFTPVGWHVIDTAEARDPVAEFGVGNGEYQRAKNEADRLNGATA